MAVGVPIIGRQEFTENAVSSRIDSILTIDACCL